MKLYLTQILKEANELGFGAPGQGGNAAATSMANISFSNTSKPTPASPPSAPVNNQMMLPNAGMNNGVQMNAAPGFKTII